MMRTQKPLTDQFKVYYISKREAQYSIYRCIAHNTGVILHRLNIYFRHLTSISLMSGGSKTVRVKVSSND